MTAWMSLRTPLGSTALRVQDTGSRAGISPAVIIVYIAIEHELCIVNRSVEVWVVTKLLSNHLEMTTVDQSVICWNWLRVL